MEDNILERLTRLETNMDWVKKQQYVVLATQLSMIMAFVVSLIKG